MLSFNFDLLTIGLAIAAILILGFIVFYRDNKSATNRLFLLFTIATSGWAVFNYLSYQVFNYNVSLWLVRLVMFSATFVSLFFLLLVLNFPQKKFLMSKKLLLILLAVVLPASILTLTPAVFSKIEIIPGQPPKPIPAPGIIVFALVSVTLVLTGIFLLLRKTIKTPKEERGQFLFLLIGMILMFSLIIFFNFILVTFLGNSSFIPLSGIFVLPFVLFTFYAIVKHQLLDIRIIGTEILTVVLIFVTFLEVLLAKSLGEIIFRIGVLFALVFVGILLIKSIINEVKQREQLQSLTDKLKALDKQKDEFISMAAHEMRAPMTAIKGYVSMVLEGDTGDIPEKARGFLADANNINDRLIRLVNNMLNVGRIEEGRMVYQIEDENLSGPIRMVFNQFTPEVERKGLDYKLEIPTHLKDKVRVDPDRIQEVIGNFLSNAVKYTDSGSIKVKLSQRGSNHVRCEVIDTGPGISSEEQAKLFQKFHRVESNVGKTTGTGLGLYICKLLVEKFGGKIGLRSVPEKGSTFWFDLPLVT